MTEFPAAHTFLAPALTVGISDDPCIEGTDVEIYRIAALLAGGATVEEVVEDYPGLSAEQIRDAAHYAEIFPNRGRPYPEQSFKRATRELGLDVLDELLAAPDWSDEAQ